MRSKLINFFRIFFIVILIVLGIAVLFRPAHTETNILKAIFSSAQDNLLVDLSSKFSAKINIIVESDDAEKAENISKTIYAKLDNSKIYTTDTNITKILSDYEKYHNNLLSNKTQKLLVQKQYEQVQENAYEMLYNPVMPPIGSIDEDPFLLLTDFVMNLSSNTQISNFTPIALSSENSQGNKFYSVVMLDVDKDLALSPTVLNQEVKKLIDMQKEMSDKDTKIFLTGAPIHSFFASSRSIFEINLICVLSSIFVIGLIFMYFKSLKPLFPIAISIGLGIYSGYCVTALIFHDIHILTFVFSTTLIGICVDYSLHYFVALNNKNSGKKAIVSILKSLSVSLITTVSAFLILLFANFILLRQISVFTISGLVTVYFIVTLFYPLFFKKMSSCSGFKNWKINLKFPKNFQLIFSIVVAIICLVGLCKINFDDNIKNMYTPPKKLLYAEKLFAEIAGKNSDISILVVHGNNLEEILQKEEKIAENLENYQALSKFIPSQKRQKSNQILRKKLYQNRLNNYATFLPIQQRNQLLNQKISDNFLELNENFGVLKNNFLIDKNTSIMIVSDYTGKKNNDVKIINFQKDISKQIKHCRKISISLLAPIFVFLYILLSKIYDYKSGFKIILPSLISVLLVFGFLGFFNCSINLFHILAIFLIVGFGLDYSVFRFSGIKDAEDAVFMSCLTTVFSFALLSFAGFKLISSLGTVLTLGLLSSYIFSLKLITNNRERQI